MNSIQKQTVWTGDNVRGYSIDPYTGSIDTTEGFGAIDQVCKIKTVGPRIIDLGGGAYDDNVDYLFNRYHVASVVYDPFKRDKEHNAAVLAQADTKPFDTALSLSVLNVIDREEARLEHIRLCKKVVKIGGEAIFLAWSGDQTGVGKPTQSGYQSNRGIETYLDEIIFVFGDLATSLYKEEQVVCCIHTDD